MSNNPPRLPSLDGLRAISIALVLLGHLNGTRNFGSYPISKYLGDLAHLGVVVFFVISGFLITTLLLKEHAKTGTISLSLFYARRTIRIFPAAFAYVGVIALASAAGWVVLQPGDILHSLTYTMNFDVNRSWWVGHLWSLSVEEQFYLLWPTVFLLLGPRKSMFAAGVGVALGPVARLAGWYFLRHSAWRDAEMFPMVADSLAAGCLMAGIRDWLGAQPLYRRLQEPRWSALLLVAVLVLNRFMAYSVVKIFGEVVLNLFLAILIDRSSRHANDPWGRFLNLRPMVTVGILSYSLYLWQQPFLNRESTALIASFPLNLLLAVTVAVLSYELLEKPLLKLRQRLRGNA